MQNILQFTEEEISEYNLNIPTDEEVEEMLEELAPYIRAGTNSGERVDPSDFCVCSRLPPSFPGDCGNSCTVV